MCSHHCECSFAEHDLDLLGIEVHGGVVVNLGSGVGAVAIATYSAKNVSRISGSDRTIQRPGERETAKSTQ